MESTPAEFLDNKQVQYILRKDDEKTSFPRSNELHSLQTVARIGFAKLHFEQIILLFSLGISSVSKGLKFSPNMGSGLFDNKQTISAESRSYMAREAARDLRRIAQQERDVLPDPHDGDNAGAEYNDNHDVDQHPKQFIVFRNQNRRCLHDHYA